MGFPLILVVSACCVTPGIYLGGTGLRTTRPPLPKHLQAWPRRSRPFHPFSIVEATKQFAQNILIDRRVWCQSLQTTRPFSVLADSEFGGGDFGSAAKAELNRLYQLAWDPIQKVQLRLSVQIGNILHHVRVFLKLFYLISLGVPLAILVSISFLVSRANQILPLTSLDGWVYEKLWKYVYWATEAAGPCYIKFLQWVATRGDLFPSEVCFRCAKFHCNVAPHGFPFTALKLEETFGSDWESKMWIDPEPVGAGSIAQVYRGFLKETTPDGTFEGFRQVAIKVLHPHVRDAMAIDLAVMSAIAGIAERIPTAEYLALRDAVSQFSGMMLLQLDLMTEGQNIEKFRSNFLKPSSRKHLLNVGSRVVFPRAYLNLSSSDVLVESYEEGMILGDWMRLTSLSPHAERQQKGIDMKDMRSAEGKGQPSQQAAKSNENANRNRWKSKGFYLEYLQDESIAEGIPFDPLAPRPTMWQELRKRIPHAFGTAQEILADQYNRVNKQGREILGIITDYLGIPWNPRLDPAKSEDYGARRYWTDVANAGLAFFLQMVFVDNFVHADLHPGNLMIRFRRKSGTRGPQETGPLLRRLFRKIRRQSNGHEDKLLTAADLKEVLSERYGERHGREEGRRSDIEKHSREAPQMSTLEKSKKLFIGDFRDVDFEIVILDCGITTSLSVREYCNFTDLLRCIGIGDGYTAGKLILERARKQRCKDVTAFCAEMDELVQVYHLSSQGGWRLSDTKIGEVLSRVLRIACHHHVELDPRFVSLIVAVVVLEGVGRQLNPNIDLLKSALPYVADVLVEATIKPEA